MSTEKPENVQPKQVSGADAFRKRAQERDQGVAVELPSGLVMSLRRPSVTKMIKMGHIPADVAASMQNVTPGKKMQGDDLKKYMELLDMITIAAAVSPKVVANGSELQDGEITADMLEDQDKQFIMNYVQAGVTDLTPFRAQPQS